MSDVPISIFSPAKYDPISTLQSYALSPSLEDLFLFLEQNIYLNLENVFQVSGSDYFMTSNATIRKNILHDLETKRRISAIKRIKRKICKENVITHEITKAKDVHIASELLKVLLFQMKEPVLTFVLHEKFVKAQEQESISSKIISFRSLLFALSSPRQALLWRLISLLKVFLQPEHVINNHLSIPKVSAIFGPIILRHQWRKGGSQISQKTNSAAVIGVIDTFLSHYETIFKTTNEAAIDSLKMENTRLVKKMQNLKNRYGTIEQDFSSERLGKHRTIIRHFERKFKRRIIQQWAHTARKKSHARIISVGLEEELVKVGLSLSPRKMIPQSNIVSPSRLFTLSSPQHSKERIIHQTPLSPKPSPKPNQTTTMAAEIARLQSHDFSLTSPGTRTPSRVRMQYY